MLIEYIYSNPLVGLHVTNLELLKKPQTVRSLFELVETNHKLI